MPCECLCAYDSWFVLNLIVILFCLLFGYNGVHHRTSKNTSPIKIKPWFLSNDRISDLVHLNCGCMKSACSRGIERGREKWMKLDIESLVFRLRIAGNNLPEQNGGGWLKGMHEFHNLHHND